MKLKELFVKAIGVGMDNDPRGKDAVLKELQARKKEFADLKEKDKEFFDQSSLSNPYADTRILHGSGDEDIRTAIVGIDMEVGEVALTHALRTSGTRVDLIIAHHPEGAAYANLYEVMRMQSDILARFGVPVHKAEGLMETRIKEVERRLMPANHARAVDAARLLNIPMINLHTPADNMVATYLQRLFETQKPEKISDVLDMILNIPEYREAKRQGAGPKVLLGSDKRTAGKIFVDMTGGTEGSKEIFESLTTSGISTLVCMHLSDDHRKEAEKNHLNVVIAGHISSDNLGLNLLFDRTLDGTDVTLLECSGYRRFKRA